MKRRERTHVRQEREQRLEKRAWRKTWEEQKGVGERKRIKERERERG